MSALDVVARGLATRARIAAFRPSNREVAFVGDSITATNWVDALTQASRGPSFWMQAMSQAGARCPSDANFGTSGATAPTILGTLAPQAAASSAGTVMHLSGTNDRANGLTAADTIAAVQGAVALYLAAGKGVILAVPFPRSSPFALTGTQLGYHLAVRRALLIAYGTDPRVRIVDVWGGWAQADGSCIAGRLMDGLHPAPAGALELGTLYAAAFDAWFAPASLLATTNADLWSAANPTGNLLNNGMLAGTGGALAGTPAPSGAAPPYCTLDSLGATGVTLAGAKVTSGNIELQQLTVGGTPTGATPSVQLRQSAGSIGWVSTGDVIEGLFHVEADAGQTGLQGVRGDLTIVDGGGTRAARAGERETGGAYPVSAWKGVIRTPRLTVGASATNLTMSLNLMLAQNVAAAVVVRTGRWMLRKVG